MPVLQSSDHVSYMGLKGFALNYVGHWSCPYLISNRQLGWQDTDMVQKGGTTPWSEESSTKAGNTCQLYTYYVTLPPGVPYVHSFVSWGHVEYKGSASGLIVSL